MNAHIGYITLGVGDLNRAKQFYRDGLGWPVQVDRGDTAPTDHQIDPLWGKP